jgi:hypothetical protein
MSVFDSRIERVTWSHPHHPWHHWFCVEWEPFQNDFDEIDAWIESL